MLGPTFLLPDNVSPPELIQEQQLDYYFCKLFESVLPSDEIQNVAHGYFFTGWDAGEEVDSTW